MNKKLLVVAFAAVVVFGSLAVVADAGGLSGWAKFCQANWDGPIGQFFGWENQGDCVSWLAKNYNNSWAAKFCQDNWDGPIGQFFGWKNQGDCVSFWRNGN
ncbi:MAG: hypothetical protein ACYTG3_16855 [Planctomycetota bacterium]|jgi:hypothetical protein